MWDAGPMPWAPELFTAPVLQRLLDQRRLDEIVDMPYFDGLLAGEPDALVESFSGSSSPARPGLPEAGTEVRCGLDREGEEGLCTDGAAPEWLARPQATTRPRPRGGGG